MIIVKVQISEYSSDGEKQMLIYNKDRTLWFEGVATKDVLELMRGKPKLFFEAEVEDNKFKILKAATFQNW